MDTHKDVAFSEDWAREFDEALKKFRGFIESNPEAVSDNRRVREKTLSPNTTAYSVARTRLETEVNGTVSGVSSRVLGFAIGWEARHNDQP